MQLSDMAPELAAKIGPSNIFEGLQTKAIYLVRLTVALHTIALTFAPGTAPTFTKTGRLSGNRSRIATSLNDEFGGFAFQMSSHDAYP